MNSTHLKTLLPSDLQSTLNIRPILGIRPTFDIRLISNATSSAPGFESKSYVSYSREAQTVCKKTNIFYLISDGSIEPLSL